MDILSGKIIDDIAISDEFFDKDILSYTRKIKFKVGNNWCLCKGNLAKYIYFKFGKNDNISLLGEYTQYKGFKVFSVKEVKED